jgi:glutamate-1-semialdehyde 2,1-aminomutase
MKIQKSINLYSKALELLPGGVNSPVRAFKSVGGNPIFMHKGKGSHIYDEDGNKYIDYCMSWGPLILGHADKDVIKAVCNTAKNSTSFGTPNKFEVEIADMIVKRFQSVEKVRFVSSGTEAAMSAIRLARGYTGRDKIIKFDGCYHGHADYLLVAGGSGLATFGTPDSAGVTKANAKDTIVVPYNDLNLLEKALKKDHKNIAGIILEPVPCNYGLIPPKDNYLKDIRDLCDKYNVLLIFDEVITGLRLSMAGAQQFFGVKPDITVLGKIIGGGLPVGAYGASTKIMAKIAPDGPVYQAGTLSGNPVAMSAGIATLKKLDQITYERLNNNAKKFKELLRPSLEKYSGKLLFLQIESIFAFYFTNKKNITSVSEVKQCDMKLFAKFHAEILKRGVYLSPSGFEVGFLSTAHSERDLAMTADAIAESLEAIL